MHPSAGGIISTSLRLKKVASVVAIRKRITLEKMKLCKIEQLSTHNNECALEVLFNTISYDFILHCDCQ